MQETIATALSPSQVRETIPGAKARRLQWLCSTAKAMPCLSGAFGPQKAMKIFPR